MKSRSFYKNTQRALLTTVAACALLSSAWAGDWIGPSGGDLFDPSNWSDGVPPNATSGMELISINNGKAVGDLSIHSYMTLHNVGVGSGANGELVLDDTHVLTNVYGDISTHYMGNYTNFHIGGSGGTGKFTLNTNSNIEFKINPFFVGSGAGSTGAMNVLGTGKNAPFSGVCSSLYYCGNYIEIQNPTSVPVVSEVGAGGVGTAEFNGAGLALFHASALHIGVGGGSVGTFNVLNHGKLTTSPVNISDIMLNDPNPVPLIGVGQAGGQGTLNVNNSTAIFSNGLAVGSGSGSQGNVNLLGGGKAHSYINSYSGWCPVGMITCTDQEVAEKYGTKVGIDNGSGALHVRGDGSKWYVSGIFDSLLYWGPPNTSAPGHLFVGYSGQGSLTIGDGGMVRIGSNTVESIHDPVTGSSEPTLLEDSFVADGTLHLGYQLGSKGSLNIGSAAGSAATAPGTLETGAIQFGAGVGEINLNHTAAAYFFDTSITDGIFGNGTINAIAGRTILEKNQPFFRGNLVSSSGILQVNGNYSSTSSTSVQAGGTLEGIGIVSSVTNAGTVSPGGLVHFPGLAPGSRPSHIDIPAFLPIGTLTIQGNYSGLGGTVVIDTVLGSDNSVTDLLHITGDTSGNSLVQVNNVGGLGAATFGDGIRIIQIDGVSAGTFTLQSAHYINTRTSMPAIIAGAYAYSLFQNGLSGADGNWYLRSQVNDPGGGGGNGGGGNGGGGVVQLYQPLAPVAEAYPQAMLATMQMETLRQRSGSRYHDIMTTLPVSGMAAHGGGPVDAEANIENVLIWTRVSNGRVHFEPKKATAEVNSITNDYWTVRSQVDTQLYESGDNAVFAGVNVHYGQSQSDIRSLNGNGKIESDRYGVGVTLTWLGLNGFYIDAQAQASWFDSDLSSEILGTLAKGHNGFGYAFSVEGGKQFRLNDNWSVTPQMQLSYENVRFSKFEDRYKAITMIEDGDQLTARFGVALEYQNVWQDANGQFSQATVYGIANLYQDLLDGTSVDLSNTKLKYENEKLWGGLGLGVSYGWANGKYRVYGEGNMRTSLENFGDSYSYIAYAGFQVKW